MINKKIIKTVALVIAMLTVFSLVSCTQGDTLDHPDTSGQADTTSGVANTTVGEETTAEPADKTVKLTFIAAGDNIGHENVYTDALNRATETSLEYNFVPMYNDIAPLIGNADIAFINQETMMADKSVSGGRYTGYPDFNSPQDMGRALVELGFDIDMDLHGIEESTVKQFHERGLKVALWTANTLEALAFCRSLGVDFIESDVFSGRE